MLIDFIVVAQEHLVTHGTMGGRIRCRTVSFLVQRFRRWSTFILVVVFVVIDIVDSILDDIVHVLIRVRSRRRSREELKDGQVR